MNKALRFAPEQILAAAALVAAIVVIGALWMATHVPSLGLELEARDDRLVVAGTWSRQAPAGLTSGFELLAIAAPGANPIALKATDLTPEPDATFNNSNDYQAFLRRQDVLASTMAAPTVILHGAQAQFEQTGMHRRPLVSLPWSFWLQLLCGVLGFIIGAGVWAYKPGDTAVRCYALTGVGLMLAAVSAAVYSTRELALPLALFEPLTIINHAGTLLYAGAFAGVLWVYPARLGTLPAAPVLVAVYALLALPAALHWWPTMDAALRIPCLLAFVLAIVFAIWQWRRSKGDALARAGLRWFLFSWLLGSGLFLALVFVPPLFGIDSAQAQAPAFMLLLVIHLALAVGILNYRLFDLDRWWAGAMLLGLSGLLVCALDLFLVYALNFVQPLALGASAALVGWLYFPARQWLWSRFVLRGQARRQPGLVRMVTDALSHPEVDPALAWRRLLDQVFAPRTTEALQGDICYGIAEGGLALNIAAAEYSPALRLQYCRGGARLFNRGDLDMVADLRRLFAELVNYRGRLDQAVAAERDRVARDLHDDVGARLLTLSHSLDGRSAAAQARQALAELRAVVYSMRAPPADISDLLGDWRAETAERCDAAGVDFEWNIHGEPPAISLAGGPALALSRVIRETLSNALRHSGATKVSIRISFERAHMTSSISHAYQGGEPALWRESLGLHNLRDRLAHLGGHIEWLQSDGRLECRWTIDLNLADEPSL